MSTNSGPYAANDHPVTYLQAAAMLRRRRADLVSAT